MTDEKQPDGWIYDYNGFTQSESTMKALVASGQKVTPVWFSRTPPMTLKEAETKAEEFARLEAESEDNKLKTLEESIATGYMAAWRDMGGGK